MPKVVYNITKRINIYKILFTIVLSFLILNLWLGAKSYSNGGITYENMMLNDWFINYEGGFVRRGIIGQLLICIYRIHPFHVTLFIILFYFVGLLFLVRLLVKTFKSEGWSFFIAIFPVVLYVSFLGVRRDYWCLIIAYFIFLNYAKYLKTNNLYYIIITNILGALEILIHEASFFFTIPILVISNFLKSNDKSITKKSLYSLILCMPTLLCFVLVCMYKGNLETAKAIWNSWTDYFIHYPLSENLPSIGSAVEWLSYNTRYAIELHTSRFWLSSFIYNIPSLPFTLYTIGASYYIITMLNSVDLGIWSVRDVNRVKLSNFLITHFIFLLPMFGFLSCDFNRIIMYWSVSSIFAYHWLKDCFIFPHFLNTVSSFIQEKIDNNILLSNRIVFLFILITIPIADTQGSNILSCFAFIPYGWRLSFWQHLLNTLPTVQ